MNDYLRRAADTALLQLVDISKLGLNSKIKKFSYSFICGKGYSPPSGGESLFVYSLRRAADADLPKFMPNSSVWRLTFTWKSPL